ncbi:WbqC family protein [Zhouia amylolytica]|uniref:WbqC-like protein n=1 Tax=Zhouia amylolytica AD3 TaxID=1286632 RepID=W2UU60_9FLAO|nr:WbqC family protein [Zhouia amylolytica]ETN97066.1 hypothetical protein P278_04920 [Zhouia amylolytica AD3]
MKALLHPTYFPSISHFVTIANKEIIFEVEDNYQKQTYRNRTFIYSPNGKQLLSIPIKHAKGTGRRKYKDVQIDNGFSWKKQHWKSIETAYRTSPYFEFYEDEIAPIFQKKHRFLMDLNFETIELISECLQFEIEIQKTDTFQINPENNIIDFRSLVESKKEPIFNFDNYIQVFGDKHGFIENLSIIDLLFNEGPNAISYLESQPSL